MCGLVGVLSAPSVETVKLFDDMLAVDILRGPDSTGVLCVNRTNWEVMKSVGPPAMLQHTAAYNEMTGLVGKAPYASLLMGHNRAATKGKVVEKNAHPFTHGNITLAHNGTLTTVHTIKEASTPDFDTDSEHVAYAVDKKGIDWVWPRLRGAATLTWWQNEGEGTLHIASNGKRPMFYATIGNGKGFLYASEPWMIQGMCMRNKCHIDGNVIMLAPNVLYTIKRGEGVACKVDITTRELGIASEEVPALGPVSVGTESTLVSWDRRRGEFVPPKGVDVKPVNHAPPAPIVTPIVRPAAVVEVASKEVSSFPLSKNQRKKLLRAERRAIHRAAREEGTLVSKAIKCCYCGDTIADNDMDCTPLGQGKIVCASCTEIASLNNMQLVGDM